MTTQEYDVETINRLYAVNAELLEALEAVLGLPHLVDADLPSSAGHYPIRHARAAIAKAKP